VSVLNCCDSPRHETEADDGYLRVRCLNCGEWWSVDEYDRLVDQALTEWVREVEHFEHGYMETQP
jgi:hypothetical protein